MRLIDSDKLEEKIEEINSIDYGSMDSFEAHNAVNNCLRDIVRMIDYQPVVYQPVVDAVPVVRCGECKFFQLHPNDDFAENTGICTKHSHYCDFSKCESDRFSVDFCSYGIRKDTDAS